MSHDPNTFPVDPDRPFSTLSLGFTAKPFETSRNLTLQGTTTYDLFLTQNLDFEFVGGVQWFRQTRESNLVSGQVFPATGPAVNNAVSSSRSGASCHTRRGSASMRLNSLVRETPNVAMLRAKELARCLPSVS